MASRGAKGQGRIRRCGETGKWRIGEKAVWKKIDTGCTIQDAGLSCIVNHGS
jgi:hypothetical protein